MYKKNRSHLRSDVLFQVKYCARMSFCLRECHSVWQSRLMLGKGAPLLMNKERVSQICVLGLSCHPSLVVYPMLRKNSTTKISNLTWNDYSIELVGNKRYDCWMCFIITDERAVDYVKKCRLKVEDFEMLKVIGRGAFGEVQLVSMILNNIP